jgi:hypothetical protein
MCTQSGCLGAALQSATAIAQVTASLAAPEGIDAASWGVVWDEASLAITPGGAPIPEAGIAIGEADAAPISETVRLYAEACRAGGGLVDDTGGVTALPTTEGGWTCWSADRACYHHLTVSGWLYANGGTGQGCAPLAGFLDRVGVQQLAAPEVIRPVVPAGGGAPPANGGAPAAAPPQAPPAAMYPWDGTYQLTPNRAVCSPGCEMLNPWDGDTITVILGGVLYPPPGGEIDSNGRANGVSQDTVRALTSIVELSLAFSSTPNGGAAVTGTYTEIDQWTVTASGGPREDRCVRQISGVRID